MKVFIIKCSVMSAILIGMLVAVNFFYVRTDGYESQSYRYETRKFESVPEKIDLLNLGSSHALYAFDYELPGYLELGLQGFNAALSAQHLLYDQVLYNKYFDRLREGATVIIPVAHPTFIPYSKKLIGAYNPPYYQFLSPKEVISFDGEDYVKYKLLPILSANSKKKYLYQDIEYTTVDEGKSLKDYEGDLKALFETRAHYYAGFGSYDKGSEELLYEIIDSAQKAKFRIIIVLLPVYEEFLAVYESEEYQELYEDYYRIIEELKENRSLSVLDYREYEGITKEAGYFRDPDHLNEAGRLVFTEVFLEDLSDILDVN